jgi:signal peptidase I
MDTDKRKDQPQSASKLQRPKIPKPLEISIIIVFAVILSFLVQAFLFKPYLIPSGSMQPTLEINDRIIVNRLAYKFSDPQPGDVIVFHPPSVAANIAQPDSATNLSESFCGVEVRIDQLCPLPAEDFSSIAFVKRIIAGPGDTVAIEDGYPVVNGQKLDSENYRITDCDQLGYGCNFIEPITVPEDHYFMLGDNRGSSFDSRFWGPLPEDQIIGKVGLTYWPLNRMGQV